ncbi:MAG: hypothetical protein JWP72_342 [Massilia sp.]|nr:hypothetical protein [Massilia sp.]MDB5792700.1 hypothetical protein [Massilia sp.]
MSETQHVDPRADAQMAARVDRALKILETDGMHAAFAFMQLAGVPRGVARRVLCSPKHARQHDRRRLTRSSREA